MSANREEPRIAFESDFVPRPYRAPAYDFSQNQPASRYGSEAARHRRVRRFLQEAEPTLKEGWLSWMARASSPAPEWRELQEAVRYAWLRKRGL